MSYRLGVDVGGTFTDLILVNEETGDICSAKVPSTPHDSVGRRSATASSASARTRASIRTQITHVMHGTTVATNTVLTHTGAKVGLVTTKGYRQVLQIARSFVPGGLGGWVIYNKSLPLAPLALTIEADERIGARGRSRTASSTRQSCATDLRALGAQEDRGADRLADQLLRQPAHEQAIAKIAAKVLPGIPVSLSSEVVPEMQEYERTVTTVANSYVRPSVSKYVRNLHRELKKRMKDVQAAHAAFRRRSRLGQGRGGMSRQPADDRPGRRRLGRALGRDAGGLPEPADVRHGRHLDRRGAGAGRQGAAAARDERARRHGARVVGRRAHRGRRRRLDRPRAGAHRRAARRTADRRRRAGAGRLRPGRHGADRDRRQRRAWLPAERRGAARRRHGDPPRSRARRPCRRSPPR